MDQSIEKVGEEDKSIVLESESNLNKELYREQLKKNLEQIKREREQLQEHSSDGDEFQRKKVLDSLKSDVESLEAAIERPENGFDFSLEQLQGLESDARSLRSRLADFSDDINGNTKVTEVLKRDLQRLDESISSIRNLIDSLVAEYESSQGQLEEMAEEEISGENGLLSEEEMEEAQVASLAKKDDQKNITAKLLLDIEKKKNQLNYLNEQKQAKQSDYDKAEALDLTVEEYLEIEDAISRKKVEEVLMSKKGVSDIFHKPAKDRTEEERQQLREVKDEIFKEVHAAKKENNVSAFDAIELIYHLDIRFSKEKNPRVLQVSSKDVSAINDATSIQPTKVVGDKSKSFNRDPGKGPDDMKDTVLNSHSDIDEQVTGEISSENEVSDDLPQNRGFREKVALYTNLDTGDVYVREYGLSRFGIESIGTPVMINGVQCFPISRADARIIIEQQDNDNSPYEVVSRDIQSKQIQSIDNKEMLQRMRYIHDLLEYTKEHNIDIYQYYLDFANQYRNNPDFVPQDFELENPFLDEASYQGLKNSNEALINQYFATVMNKVIKSNLADYRRRVSNEETEEKAEMTNAGSDSSRGMEKFVLYRDSSSSQAYVLKPVLERFGIGTNGREVEINGRLYFPILEGDVSIIESNQNNDFSPYIIEERTFDLEDTNTFEQTDSDIDDDSMNRMESNTDTDADEDTDNQNDTDTDDDSINQIDFNMDDDHQIPIDTSTDADDDIDNQNDTDTDDDSINQIDSNMDDDHQIPIDTGTDDSIDSDNVEYIPIFRVTNDENRLYTTPEYFERFGMEPLDEAVDIRGIPCYHIHDDQMEDMQQIVDASENPKLAFKYIDVLLDKKENDSQDKKSPSEKSSGNIHYQTVIQKLTVGLDNLSAKNAKRYRASNISVSAAGHELRTGNYLYNVFGFLPGTVTMPILALRKLAAKLLLSAEGKEDYVELQRRLNEDLTEEELEVLFRDYRGSHAKADNNPAINSFIADRMRRYALEKVEKLNELIREDYSKFFGYLQQIEALDARLAQEDIPSEVKESLTSERTHLMREAAQCACSIDHNRNEGIQLLSGTGLHGFEEDMKAVDSKMSYVGYRFAKAGEFDHETQALLAEFGQKFNDAVAALDAEAIVESFIKYEACYATNTQIEGSIFGKRSVGSKYYTPLIEEFDYRDDPFVRNLLSTIAISSAAVSAANAYYVHKVEADQLLHQHKEDIDRANEINDAAIGRARRVGGSIEGYRGTMMNGIESQIRHSTDEAALGLERSALDATSTPSGWNLGADYVNLDRANHIFYNGFHQDVSSRLSGIASSYGSGAIDQAEALREMVEVANASSTTLNDVVVDCLSILEGYAKTHPDFDLQAIEESMSYIVSHPDAIIDMNNGIVDIMDQASTLSGLSAEHYVALSSLPSDMLTSLISAASAVSLAHHVSSVMRNQYGHKGHYGNEVTEMMDQYLYGSSLEEPVEDEVHHSR